MNDDIMRELGFNEQLDLIREGCCPICKKKIKYKDFKDRLSQDEYRISGLCQKCQDGVFKDE